MTDRAFFCYLAATCLAGYLAVAAGGGDRYWAGLLVGVGATAASNVVCGAELRGPARKT